MKFLEILAVLLVLCLPLVAHEARIQVRNGVPQIYLDGRPVRPRWTYNRTQQGLYGPRGEVPSASSFLLAEPVRREFLFTAPEDMETEVVIHLKLYEYDASKPALNWWIDDFAFEDLTDGTALIPLETFDSPDHGLLAIYPQDAEDFQGGWTTAGGRDDSSAYRITWRNIVSRENDGLPYHVFTLPRRMTLKAGHDYRVSFWSNADETARLLVTVRALPDYHICLPEKYDVMQSTLRLAKEADVEFVTTMVECPWPRPGEAPDWVVTDTTMDHILAVMPEAKIVPRFEVTAPAWWYEAHPDDLFGYHPGAQFPQRPIESFCSPLWRREALEHLRMLVNHLEEKYGEHIVGYHPCPSREEEYFWPGSMATPDFCGYGPREVAAWRAWLARKYGSDAALKQAWSTSEVTLETAQVPSPERYATCDAVGVFLRPATCRDLIDHNEFLSDEMADVLLEFAHAIRELCGKNRLTVAFYGYLLETAAAYHQPAIGHDALERVLASPDVDILCSPVSYWDRLEGGGGYVMAPVESVTNAGKLWFMEDDDRTHLAASGDMGGIAPMNYARNRESAQHILLRNLGQQLVRNLGSWWMDLGSWRWFEDPALWEMMRAVEAADRFKLDHPTPYRPPVALFVDERAYNYSTAAIYVPGDEAAGRPAQFLRHPASTHAPLISASRKPLARLGTGVGHYLLTDLLKGEMPGARLCVFTNAWVLTAAERAMLRQRSQGRFALWCLAPGYVDPENGMDVKQIEELTGFQVAPLEGSAARVLATSEGLAAGLDEDFPLDEPPLAMAVVEQPGDLVLARWPSGEAAIVQRGSAIYNASTALSWPLLRHAARAAGVHLYTDQECICYTDGQFIVLHGIRDETVTVTLPAPADAICDATNMLPIAEHTDRVAIPLKFGETRVLYLR